MADKGWREMQLAFVQGLLELFRAEVVDGAFGYGFECEHDGCSLWFVQLERRVEFSLNIEGLCAARCWLAGLDRLMLVA
jgi:hypothetical protein